MELSKNVRVLVAFLVITASTLVGIAVNEGYSSSAIIPVKGDKPTVGFGETSGVTMASTTTPPKALVQLLSSVNSHADGIRECIHVPISQNEFDAYVSFAYNVGTSAFCHSTLNKKLNAGDYEGACKELLKWDYSGGVQYAGLTKRRQQEYATCKGIP